MRIIGSILILLVFVITYYYFADKRKRQNNLDKESKEKFWSYLENIRTNGRIKPVFACKMNDSEIPVADVLKNISLSENTRIKQYSQN